LVQISRGRSGSRAAGRWSGGSRDVGFRCAGSSRWNGAVTSGRDRSLFWNFSFFFVLAGIGALSVGSIFGVVLLLLRLADVPDKGFGVGIIHIAVG
jgi:hypothetical protein